MFKNLPLKYFAIAIAALIVAGVGYEGVKIWRERGKVDTTGWQTYRNEEYGFEIKYPKSLVAEEKSPPAQVSPTLVTRYIFTLS